MGGIKIGWSSKSITPDQPIALAGQLFERITDTVRDPLMATALVLDSSVQSESRPSHGMCASDKIVVLVSCDLVSIDKHIMEGVRKEVRQIVPELDPESIILIASHTHTGPLTGDTVRFPNLGFRKDHPHVMSPQAYSEFAILQIAEAVKEAWRNRKEGAVSWGQGLAPIGFNRRVVYDDGTAMMYGAVNNVHFKRFGGPEDMRVEVLYTWDTDNQLTGILFNAACTAQIVEGLTCISADYFGEIRKMIGEKFPQQVYVLGMIGAAGDLAPRDTLNKHRRQYQPEKDLRQAAIWIIRAMEDALETASQQIQSNVVFRHRVQQIDLSLRKVTKSEVGQAREYWNQFNEQLQKQEDATAFFISHNFQQQCDIFNSYAILQREQELRTNPYYRMELHTLRIGDIVIATNPFELFTEYGLQIKARSIAKQTFIAQLSCDIGGYLPTAEAIATGGYSTQVFSGFVGADSGDMLVDYTLQAISSLWNED